jgi:protease-4
MDQIYEGFVTRVSEGRKLPPERVREIARGRVWTGVQAKQLGLVDELGGIEEAVEKAKALAKIDGEVHVKKMGGASRRSTRSSAFSGSARPRPRPWRPRPGCSGDPRSSRILDELGQARLRAAPGGASVLADTPIH